MNQYYELAGQSTVPAAEDLTDKCGLLVKMTSTGVAVCDTLGENVFGVLGTPGTEGENVLVYTGKDVPVWLGGTVAFGADLMTNAEGKAVTRVGGAGNALVGKAGSAGAADELHTVYVKPQAVLD